MITAADTLVLNSDGLALNLTKWRRAVVLLLEEKADLVEAYDNFVRPGIRQPAVIQLRAFVSVLRQPSLTRKHILARDSFACQFCGLRPRDSEGRPRVSDLNIDHVIPRAQAVGGKVRAGGKSIPLNSWGNLVASCIPCNTRKRDRTPEQAGMRLRRTPRTPTAVDALRIALSRSVIPNEWKAHLPEGHLWRGYWDVELDPN